MTPEKRVQSAIMSKLAELADKGEPLFFERRQAGGFSYKKGIPDLYAVYNGQHIEIEVKAPGGLRSPMQIKFMEKCRKLNMLCICADCVDDVLNLLSTLKGSSL